MDPNSFDDDPISYKRPKYDVFMNFSFKDIGKSFISHLKGALKLYNFTISDHTKLPIGQDAHLQLLKAIEESEIYVLVFSPNYAFSTRCLDELVDIMDRFHKLDERKVLPVFFKLEPSHVRSQKGPFMEAFEDYKTNGDQHRVQEWIRALKDASQLSGLTLHNEDEAKFILEIVEELEKMQRPQELHVTDHPVGVKSRAEELISTLRLEWKDGVLIVAVIGLSGIGKTTIVKETFNKIARSFDLSCFIADIHNMCQVLNWKVELQKVLISCLTHESKFSFMSNHNDGVTKIISLVSRRKVLLVLDDIDNYQQLESLGICPNWFYDGSRIIVTTRDKRSLGNIPYESYHTRLLNRGESLNLFTRIMFGRDDHVNTKFIEEVVARAGGHPLVLKIWSCHFKQYEREHWPSILETLKQIPHGDVQKQLRMSYDSLTNRAKKLFLDIACFFNNANMDDKDLVVKVLQDEDSRFFPDIEIQYLVDKSLVEITSHNQLRMHHAVMEMGQEIVRQENEEEPGQRTRLVDERDVMRVLTECSGTKSVESIDGWFENMQGETLEAFRKMSNLRLIHFESVESNFFHHEITPLCFKKLKYMWWQNFPFKSFNNIDMCNVVVLQIFGGKLETLCKGIKSLKKLRILEVICSYSLTKTGNFSGLDNLEEVYFIDCVNLTELHNSISDLQKLTILDLRSSIPLKRIPWNLIGKLASLQKLFLGNYSDRPVKELGFDVVNDPLLYSLKECPIRRLKFYRCNISKISSGFENLTLLKHLSLDKTKFTSHPDSLLQLHGLNKFSLYKCNSIHSIPNLPENVTFVKVYSCWSLVNLPCNILKLKSLKVLQISCCRKLGREDPNIIMKVTGLMNLSDLRMSYCSVSQVPSAIGNLVSLKRLNLSGNLFSSLPDSLSNLSQLVFLDVRLCLQLRLLPLLPSNLTCIHALGCKSLDVMSSTPIGTKVCKESIFSDSHKIQYPWEEVLEWCNYQSNGDVLSFVAPMRLDNNICGIILCAYTLGDFTSDIVPKMHNKTKNTSHRFVTKSASGTFLVTIFLDHNMHVMSYPLDDTTLLVEAGDSMVLVFPHGSISSSGIRLIYESDVMARPT